MSVVPVTLEPSAGTVVAATLAELERVARGDTSAGQAALALARRIDAVGSDTGSALAAMVREHRAAMAEATKDAEQAVDPIDELRARRERRLRSG